jgi:hypothetical protein
MKYLILILLTVFLSCNFSNDKKKNDKQNLSISESEIYEVVNSILDEQDEIMRKDGLEINPYKYVLDKDYEPLFSKNDSILIFKTDTLFSKKDVEFMQKQIVERKNFKFNSDSIKSKIVISADTIKKLLNRRPPGNNFFEEYKLRFGKRMFYTIGLPIFSIDKKTVFIKIDSFGSGKTLIYKKVKNKWVYYCQSTNWIA